MNFRTQVESVGKQIEIRHSDNLMLFGSCFSENIGKLLMENKFGCEVNPYGILYNPLSIAKALREIISGKVYNESDLFEREGMWHSWMHHSSFSSEISSKDCLQKINSRIEKASELLHATDWLIVTWGSAYVYLYENEVVGNCHKCPDRFFQRQRISVETICEEWKYVLRMLKQCFPEQKVLFTVSPIRHVRDGMHNNQLSKATLLLAAEELCHTFDHCFYFPSYEIMMDELRDYRFYADDMLHPSKLAIDYLWECFSCSYFSVSTLKIMKEWEEIEKALRHKPFRSDSEAYRNFLTQILLRIERIKENFPYIDAQKELELCHTLLNL